MRLQKCKVNQVIDILTGRKNFSKSDGNIYGYSDAKAINTAKVILH